jgi:hypothetical protein
MKLEWLIIELIVLALAVYELASLYPHDRRTSKTAAKPSPGRPGHAERKQSLDPAGSEPIE